MNQENTSNNPTWTQDWDKEMDSDTNTSLAAHVSSFEEQAVMVKNDNIDSMVIETKEVWTGFVKSSEHIVESRGKMAKENVMSAGP